MAKLCGQIINRELGGVNKYKNRGHGIQWQTPKPVPEVYVERLETASNDFVNLMAYCQGLPIVCQFGRAVSSHLLAVTDEDGQVSIFNTEPGQSQIKRVHCWQAHDNAVFDYLWVNGDSQCLTAAGDQTVALWDSNTSTRLTNFVGHNCSVRSLAARPGSTAQFASGARDGHIMLWDTRVNKKAMGHWSNLPAKSIKYAHSLATRANLRRHRRMHRAAGPKGVMDTQQSVTCVLYHTENVLISSGANDGCVKLWDTRKWYTNSSTSLPQPLHSFQYPGHMRRLKGIVTMCVDPWKSRLFVSYTDNKVYRYELAGSYREPVEYVYAGHRNDTFFMRCALSPDGKYLLSGSGRNTGVIWEVDRPDKRPVFLVGHSEDVSAVDWCPQDLCKLATLSDDMSVRVWRPDSRERDTEDSSIMGFTYTAAIGKKCQRQSQVQIIQDEFPFSLPQGSSSEGKDPDSPAPSPPSTHTRWQEPSMRHVFWAHHQHSPRRSPRKLGSQGTTPRSPLAGASSSPGASSPGSAAQDLRKDSSKCLREDSKPSSSLKCCDSVNRASPSKSSSCLQCLNSVRSSPRTPKKNSSSNEGCSSASLLPLPFSTYALRSSIRECSPQSPSSRDQSPCLSNRGRDENAGGESPVSCRSPRRASYSRGSPVTHSPSRGKGLTTVKSPKRLVSPSKSPHRCSSGGCRGGGASPLTPSPSGLKPRRQLFNSPTAALPNSMVDSPPAKMSTPPPTPPSHKKVDWLTRYRLAKLETAVSPVARQDLSPGPSPAASPSSRVNGELLSPNPKAEKDPGVGSSKNVMPKRKAFAMEDEKEEGGEEGGTPGKRKKGEHTPSSHNTRRSGSFSKPGSSRTPRRKTSLSSPKTPTNMSIKRYLQ